MAEQVLPPTPPITGVNGVYVPGAMVYYYRSGTDTLLPVFTDQAGGTALSNPVIADSNGRIPQVFASPSEVVRITVHDAEDVLLYELDEAPFALTQLVDASDVAHTPTALNTATNVAAAIAQSDARAETKARTNSPVFTGTITAAAAVLSGSFKALSATLTGGLSAASAVVEDDDSAVVNIRESNGALGGPVATLINFFAGSDRQGWVGFNTSNGTMDVFNDDGPIQIGNGSTDEVDLRVNGTARVSATNTGVDLTGNVDVSAALDVGGALDVAGAADFSSHVDMAAATSASFRGARGLFYYTGSSTLTFGQTTSGANLAPVAIEVAGSSGGSGGDNDTTSGLTTSDITLGTSPGGTWACAGHAVQNSITEFVRTG